MAQKELNARIKQKRDSAANWESKNPVLLNGEIVLVDTSAGELRAKIGDGTKTYKQLAFSDEVLRNLITSKADKTAIPTKTSALTNDSGFITSSSNISGSAGSAAKWSSARDLTIGNKTQSIDGSANVSYSLSDIGAAATSHTHTIANVTDLQTTLDGKASSSHTHTIANVTNLQTTLDGKQATVTGAATTITSSDLTANRALIADSSGKVAVSDVTSTELGYLDGVTSNIQTQLNKKLESAPVTSVNSKTGAVTISASDISAVPTSRTVNGKALSANISLSASDVSAVPTSRTVNGKALSANISLTASDVGALSSSTTALKNPKSLTFTGASTGTYDGSSALTVNIPSASSQYTSFKQITFTLPAGGWSSTSPYTNTISLSAVKADSICLVSPVPASQNSFITNEIYCSAQAAGSLTFAATTKPTEDLPINLVVVNIPEEESEVATTCSLTTAGWSSLTQTVNVSGMTADKIVIIGADTASLVNYKKFGIYCSAQESGKLTFKCLSTPTSTITVNIIMI